jgi:hypothetical protein
VSPLPLAGEAAPKARVKEARDDVTRIPLIRRSRTDFSRKREK